MDVRQMRYFLVVAEELHFRRAAELLHISQPSLSQQILQMEEELGVKLLARSKRKVELTEAGRALVDRVRRILSQIDEAVQTVRDIGSGNTGRFTISFVSAAIVGVLPSVFKRFRLECPSVDLQLHEYEPERQIDGILRGDINVGFMHARLEGEKLASLVVQREGFIVALPAEFKAKGAVDLRSFRDHTAIIPSLFSMHGFSEHVHKAYELAGITPSKVLSTRLIMIGIHLVAAGLGIAVVPASFATVKVEGVIYRPLKFQPPKAELLAVWRRDDESMLLKRFVEMLKGSCRC
ncbi:MAG: LysR substrate-binding domain-containing protein [Candidatus Korobacteraceae bacterium]|jgi:DNA-binding transcriptional LysR family regulator